jgi:hypothetical protein
MQMRHRAGKSARIFAEIFTQKFCGKFGKFARVVPDLQASSWCVRKDVLPEPPDGVTTRHSRRRRGLASVRAAHFSARKSPPKVSVNLNEHKRFFGPFKRFFDKDSGLLPISNSL